MKTLAPKVPGGLRVVRIDRLFERLGIALHSEASRRKLEQNGYPGYPGAKPLKLLTGESHKPDTCILSSLQKVRDKDWALVPLLKGCCSARARVCVCVCVCVCV